MVNAIAGHIDVSADFHADAGMTYITPTARNRFSRWILAAA